MHLSSLFDQISTFMRDHLYKRLVKKIQTQMNLPADQSLAVEHFMKQLTPENHKSIEQGLEQLEREWYFDFDEINQQD